MGSIKRRLENLERHSGSQPEEAIRREILSRLTDEELDRLEAAIVHVHAGEPQTDEDRTILARWEAVREEISTRL
jgi:hypothetical protein